jgi:ATP-dependent DNA helicase RecG
MFTFETPIEQISRVGKITAKRLKKLGLRTAEDLIFYFPLRHEDWSKILPISKLNCGSLATCRGRIELIKNTRSFFKRKNVTEALVSDDSGSIKVVWFNQPYLVKILKVGDWIFLSGKVDLDRFGLHFTSPSYEKIKIGQPTTHTARIIPIYSTTENLTQKQIRFLIKFVLPLTEKIDDWLPEEIKRESSLIDLKSALKYIHFPPSKTVLYRAERRLKFDELFLIQLQAQRLKKELQKNKAPKINFFEKETRDFVGGLPFKLTDAQRKAAWEILRDLEKNQPMNRLLEGDVGSGKTVVAAVAILNTVLNGFRAVFMAPTEILARQHYDTFCKLFSNLNVKIGLITRSAKVMNHELGITNHGLKKNKKGPDSRFIIHDSNFVIGTHALIQNSLQFKNLGLAIVDEQHRFGVSQRAALAARTGTDCALMPHFLSMTATPIPRTLSLIFYGDLDLSIINELPAERKKIITKVVAPENRFKAYDFIRKEIQNGRQVFVICPLIDPSDKLGVKSATTEYKKLSQEIFPDLKVGLLHGRLKTKTKEQVMDDFLTNKIKILVSTAVVEVGVDVPNATIMMIEGAERFGLAQLHQFRGRVGRSKFQSYCFLFSESDNGQVLERLGSLVNLEDGFKLAEKDLEFRGPGEIYGTRQHGFPNLKIATLADYQIIKEAQKQAEKVIEDEPELIKYPKLKEKLENFEERVHLE